VPDVCIPSSAKTSNAQDGPTEAPATEPIAWKIWERFPRAEAIAQELAVIPAHWSLTPLRGKSAYRRNWQREPFIPHATIQRLLLEGEARMGKKTGRAYRAYISGFGLRTGEASQGLLALDIDGASAQSLLQALGGELPPTVSWTSGQAGRQQLLLQVPEPYRQPLQAFTRTTLTECRGCQTRPGELLELRYNHHQSGLPPSYHPATGAYRWLHSPAEADVALAPEWLCQQLLQLAQPERRPSGPKPSPRRERARASASATGAGTEPAEFLQRQVLPRLSPEQIYNWPGHNWYYGENHMRGCPPWRESQSQQSFHVDCKDGQWVWFDFGLGEGGDAVQYRWRLRGGCGTPKGQDFIDVVRELAADAGVSVPAFAPADTPEEERAQRAWYRSQQFSPTHCIDRPYFTWAVPAAGSVLAVRSGLGTGKTAWLAQAIAALPDEGWVALGYRNSLLLQACQRWQFWHLHADAAWEAVRDPGSRLALCVDSLHYFRATDFDGKNLILDEAMAVTMHLLVGGTLRKNREAILERFAAALQRANRIFVLDGFLADWCVRYLHRLAGEARPLTQVFNRYQQAPLQIEFLTGALDANGKLKRHDRSPLLRQLRSSPRPAICTDSQLEAEALARVLQQAGSDGLRVDSTTSEQAEVRTFLQAPDAYLRERQPDFLIYTPSAEAGIDISVRDYFSDQFCFFVGVLQTHAQLQMMMRVRDPQLKRWVACRTLGLQAPESERSPLPSPVTQAVEAFVRQDGTNAINGESDAQAIERLVDRVQQARQNRHYEAACTLQATRSYERRNLRDCLLASLRQAGHRVRTLVLEETAQEREHQRQVKDSIKDANARRIYQAPPLPSFQSAGRDGSVAACGDRFQLAQARLQQRLPGIEQHPQWGPAFIRRVWYDERQFLAQQELFWWLQHPQAMPAPQRAAERQSAGEPRGRWVRIRALQAVGIERFLQPEREWRADDPALQSLAQRCQADWVQRALGLGERNEAPLVLLRRLLRLLGLKLERRRVHQGGQRVARYRLCPRTWHDPDRQAVLACLERRWGSAG